MKEEIAERIAYLNKELSVPYIKASTVTSIERQIELLKELLDALTFY